MPRPAPELPEVSPSETSPPALRFRTSYPAQPFDVASEDLPDPSVIAVPGGYFVYATNIHPGTAARINVPVLFTRDLTNFTLLGDALPTLPAWAEAGYTWAPDVSRVQGGYRMYFTARKAGGPLPGGQVIGVASSATPRGPFLAEAAPLIEMTELGGAIDPSSLRTRAGQHYLYWKSDGNAVGQVPVLWGAPLSEDGRHLDDRPTELLRATAPWERALIEAPQVIEVGGRYHLFYSCADYGDDSYAVGHAVSAAPLGPFVKTGTSPVLSSYAGVAGPGHTSAFRAQDGRWQLAYHGWKRGQIGYPAGARSLHHATLDLEGPVPVVHPD